jgi:hypothetical protein
MRRLWSNNSNFNACEAYLDRIESSVDRIPQIVDSLPRVVDPFPYVIDPPALEESRDREGDDNRESDLRERLLPPLHSLIIREQGRRFGQSSSLAPKKGINTCE